MPEGDTVWLAGRRMHDALAGSPLVRSDFRVPQLATVDLSGWTVSEVVSRGKHLLTRLTDGPAEALTLHTHFRMEGSWHLYRPGAKRHGGPDWQIRALLTTEQWEAVGYRLPVVELFPTAEEEAVVGHLGPDVLGPDWDLDEAVRRLSAAPDREIGDALLDQRNLAGIGNLYKVEALFVARVSPWRKVRDVADLAGVVTAARRLMLLNRDRPEQITTGLQGRGREHWLYGREGRPCRRCGTPVTSAMQGAAPYDRISYWCPTCQPES